MGLVHGLFKVPGCLDHERADPGQERPQIPQHRHASTSRHEENMKKRSSEREREEVTSESLEEKGTSETKTERSRRRRKARERRREMRMRKGDDAQNSAPAPVRSKKGKKRAKEQHVNAIKTSPEESQDASPLSIHSLTLSPPLTPASASEGVTSHHPLRLEPLDPQPSTSPSMEGRARKRLRKPRMGAENTDHEAVPKVRVIHVTPQPSTSSPERAMERGSGRKLRMRVEEMDHEVDPPAPASASEGVTSHHPLRLEPLDPQPSSSMEERVRKKLKKPRMGAENMDHEVPKPKASPSSPERAMEGRARRKLKMEVEEMDHEGPSPCVPYEYTEVMPLSAASSQSDLILLDIKDDTSEPELQFLSAFELKHSRPKRPEPRENPPMLCWMEEITESESEMDEVQPEAAGNQSHAESNTDLQKQNDDIINTRPNGPAGDVPDGLRHQEKTGSKTKACFLLHDWLGKMSRKRKEKKRRKERERTQLSSLRERYVNSPALNHLYINKNNPNFSSILFE